MATISATKDLDVISKYLALVKESLGGDSVYIRTKETLQQLADSGDIKDADKAKIIAEVLGSLSSSISNSAMSTALQWASSEKDVELKKLELEKQLDILDYERDLKEAQAEKTRYDSVATQASTIKMIGNPTVVNGKVISVDNTGKVYFDTEVVKNQNTNLGKEGLLLDSKRNESFAAIHKVIADTYVNYGSWNYTGLSAGGLTGVTSSGGQASSLSAVQTNIAKEQAKGYSYNAWANAVTGAASMIGTIVASDMNVPDGLIPKFQNGLDKLIAVSVPVGY